MSREKSYDGYISFSYLDEGSDFKRFDLVDEIARVPPYRLSLSEEEEARVGTLVDRILLVSMHEHLGVFQVDLA